MRIEHKYSNIFINSNRFKLWSVFSLTYGDNPCPLTIVIVLSHTVIKFQVI